MSEYEVDLIAAARPNFMKVGPLYRALLECGWCRPRLVHTGQHYDPNMSGSFFRDLALPQPDVHLEIGSGTHGEQTGRVLMAYEKVCAERRPDATIVVGDVNSTLACALAATKLDVPVAHLEAGLRSGDRSMPEEINRCATDAIADILWTPSPDADANLAAEGVPAERVTFVGNIMLDAFEQVRDRIAVADVLRFLNLLAERYAVVTLHRPGNVDDPATLAQLVRQLIMASNHLPLVFPVHPRTRARLQAAGLIAEIDAAPNLRLIEPLGYIQFMNVVTQSSLVVTDSGGLQEETTYLGIPCLTLRAHTERPITIQQGTNRLVQPGHLLEEIAEALNEGVSSGRRPAYWDGKTASRVVADLKARLFDLQVDLQAEPVEAPDVLATG